MNSRTRSSGLLLLTLALAACSSPEGGPDAALRQFYQHMNGGDYTAATALYSREARQVIEDPSLAGDSAFDEWAKAETRQGQVTRIDILDSSGTEDAAELQYKVVYTDGTSKSASVSLAREGGEWRLGLIR